MALTLTEKQALRYVADERVAMDGNGNYLSGPLGKEVTLDPAPFRALAAKGLIDGPMVTEAGQAAVMKMAEG